MSREKQIEEQVILKMADDVRRIRESYFGQADYLFAKKLFEDGYHKQSEGEWRNLAKVGVYMCAACTQLSPQPYPYCPKCGAKMKGGE